MFWIFFFYQSIPILYCTLRWRRSDRKHKKCKMPIALLTPPCLQTSASIVSALVRQAPLMDSLREGPAGSCPPSSSSSKLAGVTILGSLQHETAAALIALTPINAKVTPPHPNARSALLELHTPRNTAVKFAAITHSAPWWLPVLLT